MKLEQNLCFNISGHAIYFGKCIHGCNNRWHSIQIAEDGVEENVEVRENLVMSVNSVGKNDAATGSYKYPWCSKAPPGLRLQHRFVVISYAMTAHD
jgi:hypothetical protein